MDRARRTLALVVLSVAAASLSAGCSATNPQQTVMKYDPADGETVDLGPVEVDNLLVVSQAGTEGPGTLVARLTNTSNDAQTVTFSGTGGADLDATFTVPSNGAISVGPDQDSSATLTSVGSKPGGLVEMTVSGGTSNGTSVQVPVLTSAQPYYSSLVPTPTPTPPPMTFTPTPAPSSSGGRSSARPSQSTMAPAPSMSSGSAMSSMRPSATPSFSPRPTQSASSSPL